MGTRKVVHCIGDSHTGFFSGYNIIQPIYPDSTHEVISNFKTYRLGPALAYNLAERDSTTGSNKRLFEIVKQLDFRKDILLLSFGEIDCRAHLLKQARIQNKEVEILLDECIERYISVISELRSMGFSVYVWNVIPTAMGLDEVSFDYPYYGSYIERNKLTQDFNRKLIERQEKFGFKYIGVFDDIIQDNWQTNQKYYFDKIHLNTILLPKVLIKLKKGGQITFSFWEFIRLYIKVFLDNYLKGKNKILDKVFEKLAQIRVYLLRFFL